MRLMNLVDLVLAKYVSGVHKSDTPSGSSSTDSGRSAVNSRPSVHTWVTLASNIISSLLSSNVGILNISTVACIKFGFPRNNYAHQCIIKLR